jgi:hypothetical protein
MAFDAHKNLAYSSVQVAPSPASAGTSLTVATGHGARFPAAPFNCTAWAAGAIPIPTNAEIVRVTAVVGDVLTIVRAQEGTSARAIQVGDQIALTVTVKTLTDIEAAIPSTAGLLSAVNVSAGTTSNNLSALTFSNANGVSFGLNGSVITATVGTNYQTPGAYLTTAALSQDSSKYAGTNAAITGGSITVNTSGVSVALPAYLTTAMRSDAVTLSNINVSAGTTSANLSAVTFSNANGLSFGLNAGTITGSYTVPAVTHSSATLSDGATSITLARLAFTNANGLTLTLSTAAGGSATLVGSYTVPTVTNSSWTVSDAATSMTIARLAFTNSNGLTLSLSTGAGGSATVVGSYTVPIVTAGKDTLGISNVGNTSGTTGVVSGDSVQLVLAGGNNITLSQSINGLSATITISGANAGGAQTGISSIIVSDATYTSGMVSFSNAGNVTISSSVNGATQYIRLSGNAAQTNQSAIKAFGVSNTGQTAGNTGVSTGVDWVLAGSQSITLSQSTVGGGPNTVWVQHPAWVTTAMLSNAVTLSNINVSGGTTSNNLSAITFSNGNGVSFGLNGSVMTASVAAAGGAQTGISGLIVSDATYTSGTVSFSNAGNITISSSVNGATQYIRLSGNAAQTTQSALKGFGISNTGNTAGNTGISTGIDYVLGGSGLLTLSQSTAAGGPNTGWIQHPAWLTTAMLSNAVTLSNINVSAGTTSNNLSALTFSNSNGMSFGLNASTITASYTVPTVTNSAWTVSDNATSTTVARLAFTNLNGLTLSLSTAAGGSATVVGSYTVPTQSNQTIGGYALGNTTGQSSSSTFDARTISLSGAGNVSVGYSGNAVVISGGTAAPSPVNFSAGTTSGNLGSVVFSNSNGVSFGLNGSTVTATVSTYATIGTATTVAAVGSANSVGTITRWAAEDHVHAGVGAVGISTGNTAGTTGSVLGTYWHVGGNGITLSQITSNNGSHTLVVSGDGVTLSTYEPFPAVGLSTVAVGVPTATSAAVSVYPFVIDDYVSAGVLNLAASVSFVTVGTSSGQQTMGMAVGLYTLNGSTLSSLTSASLSWRVTGNNSTYSINQVTATNYTGYGATAQTTSAGVNITSGYTGMKLIGVPINSLLSPGNYYLGVIGTNSTSSVNVGLSMSLIGAAMATGLSAFAPIGSFSSAFSTGQDPRGGRWNVGQGSWTSAGSVTMLPASMNMASISAVGQTYPLMRLWST